MSSSDPSIPWTPATTIIDEMWAGDGESDPMTESVPDMLATLFAQQRKLMLDVWPKELHNGSVPTTENEWGTLTNSPTGRRVQMRLHETYGFLIRELGEAMQHLDASKSWKDNPRTTNVPEFNEEVADCLHFFIEFCILAGISAEDLFSLYFNKSATNFNRNATGY